MLQFCIVVDNGRPEEDLPRPNTWPRGLHICLDLICTSPGYQLSIFPYSYAASNTTIVQAIDSTSCTLPLRSPTHRPRHYATLNSGISPISCLASPPALYDTRHLSLADSTFLSLLPACHTLINCVTPRLCFGSSVLPVCGFSCSS